MSFFQFEGAPCLQHSNYIFYKAFKYKYCDLYKILAIGDFFFLKILQEICIGEIELLWEDKTANQLLASLRLYFRPEHTPDGRQDDTGEDEVIALSDRMILKLDDLLPLVQHDVKWIYGSAVCGTVNSDSNGIDSPESDCCDKIVDDSLTKGEWRNGVVKDNNSKKRNCAPMTCTVNNKNEKCFSGAANVAVLSYPKYCRYRAMRRRLEGCENQWLHMAIVIAIGGCSGRMPGCRVMFCRETFENSELDTLDIRMDHMLPALKNQNRSKSKKSKHLSRKDSQQDSDSMEELYANVTPSISSSSRPRRSTESIDVNEESVSTEEQAFLIGLHKFMHDSQMPIGRIPSLGFKQIDLFYFYKQAEKLGGYDLITHKRMWKHLYDKLGGNSTNTSAATCTRKHYERLLLPYERHLRKIKSLKAKKKTAMAKDHDILMQAKEIDSQASLKENVEVVETKKIKLEKNETNDINALKPIVKDEVKVLTTQENFTSDSTVHKEKLPNCKPEHSRLDLQGETEVLEIPVIGHCIGGNSAFPALELKCMDSGSVHNLQYPPLEQQHQVPNSSAELTQNTALSNDNPCLVNANIMLRGGFLMPVIAPQMLPSQWSIMTPPLTAPSPQIKTESGYLSGTTESSLSSKGFSSKTNHTPGLEKMFQVKSEKLSHQSPSLTLGSSTLKTAHSNISYKPSPYIMSDHVQQPTNIPSKQSSFSFSSHHVSGCSSQNLYLYLHSKPPGYRPQSHLPPAPSTLYLHPMSTYPYSPLQSPITSSPPVAHKYQRKRLYPFESPSLLCSGAAFPSPDIVLDRIKNSTSLPQGATVRVPIVKQQYDDPRSIFVHTPQTAPLNQTSLFQRNQNSLHPVSSNRHENFKVKNSSKKVLQQPYSPYGQLPPLELQQPYLQHVNTSKTTDLIRAPSNPNGVLQTQQQSTSKSLPSPHQVSPVATTSKDGRLTSALFGTQFTAMPRPSKSSDHIVQSSHMSDPALGLPINPQVHPAFMNLYMPSGAQPPVTNINAQLQMLANAYGTSPAQLAAYEELVRQNGYTTFIGAPQQQQLKTQKKN